MGSSASLSSAASRPKVTRKVLVLGLSGAGKTALVQSLSRMVSVGFPEVVNSGSNTVETAAGMSTAPFPFSDGTNGNHNNPAPTKGVAMEEVAYSVFRFSFLEVGGVFRKYWGKYTDGVHGIAFIVDGSGGSDSRTLDDAAEALEEFLVGNAEARGWPIAVLVTKSDIDVHQGDDLCSQTAAFKEALAKRPLLVALGNSERRVFSVASFSNQVYSAVKAETDLRGAMDWFVHALLSAAE